VGGRLLQRPRVPEQVKPRKIFDPVTGIRMAIGTSPDFTKITVNGLVTSGQAVPWHPPMAQGRPGKGDPRQ
jgi:hypothetical protein